LGSAPPLECHSFHSCPRAKLISTRKTISIFDLGEASHAQCCSSRTRLLRSRSHIRASKTPARDGPFVARGRELREKKVRSSDGDSRTTENDFCQGVISAGRSRWRFALLSCLSTSAPAPCSPWTRAFHAGALAIGGFGRSRWRLRRTRAGHIFINGYSMIVSPFDRLRSGRSRIDEKFMCSAASPIITQKPNCNISQKSCVKSARWRPSRRRLRPNPHYTNNAVETANCTVQD
jgi:hypothetical protein